MDIDYFSDRENLDHDSASLNVQLVNNIPKLVIPIDKIELNDHQDFAIKIAANKYDARMAFNAANDLGVALLTEIRAKFNENNLTEEFLNECIQIMSSEHLQKKLLNECLKFKDYIEEHEFENRSKFYFVDLRKSILNLLNQSEIIKLLWQERHGKLI